MPTLHWIGKEKVINHHLDVPFRVLDHQYGFDNGVQSSAETDSGNKIIHGDNLEALKALLPEYESKIKCIYIDPPYNTGNENWVYNDNVNDPKIKKWLHTVVGKEGDDLSRHDKWLCMMYPRLKLLHKLLNDDGAIFVSIDDNEYQYVRIILDEIFGVPNFVANIIWQKRTSPDARATIGAGHDYILVFAKKWDNFRSILKPIQLTEKQRLLFKNPDNDPNGPWVSSDFTAQGFRPNQMYTITTPGGKQYSPPEGRCWKNVESVFLKSVEAGRVWFGKDGNGIPRRKTYLNEKLGNATWTWWPNDEVGHNQEAKKEIIELFTDPTIFETPKPKRLISRILSLCTEQNDIILDSFAGSGTTAHATLELNKEDSGTRKFILVEMEDYADKTTAERVRRVMNGYSDKKGIGGGFDYYELGQPLLIESGELNDAVPIEKIRNYIYYTETLNSLPGITNNDCEYFLGKNEDTAYYFFYQPEVVCTLNHDFLATIKTKAEQYVIYADNCLLTKEFMTKRGIIFKKIPRDITKF